MPSEKFRITTNGQSLRNPNNAFFDMTLSPNLTLDESDISAHNDRRSAHNALERQRREHLNMKFQQLAHALPSLQSVRRPSKTMIVAKSLEFGKYHLYLASYTCFIDIYLSVSSSLKRESNYMSEIQRLRQENEKLRKQAQLAAANLKKHQQKQQQNEDKETISSEDNMSSATTLCGKRKSADAQLSPPPTPKSLKETKKAIESDENNDRPQKKRMIIKQEKEENESLLNESATQIRSQAEKEVKPVINHAYPNVTNSNYFDMTSFVSSPLPSNHNSNLMYMNTPMTMYDNTRLLSNVQTPTSDSYNSMINPMLFAPYYIPTDELNYYEQGIDQLYLP
ncbi:hypothetical protein BCV72DRAFT_53509 [Rhizopus microsporus var. microsporus]|uniref:BHLH domain-containing protein n=1 Tax=Rhizopus microsporus var. microsporus TaxID=86635 RepID=A0A1X0QRK8_RHIZD|nr:hypothetical protein BCV72DRAFT_53509 [Rhizopus microsporus var. microsporus]